MASNKNRQELIIKIHKEGYALFGLDIDQYVKDYNNFEMKISERVKLLNTDNEEFKKFITFIHDKQ